jgi:gluconate:H+ symporter, GntP family
MTLVALFLSIVLIIVLTTRIHIHPFLALFVAALFFGFLTEMPLDQLVAAVNDGFRDTVGKTGLIIIFGVIIGAFLENTGAAYILTEKLLNLVGRKNVTPAMAIIGYIVSIPVFADSGYLLVSPLNKSICRKTGESFTASAVALALGLILSHTMVPPTPGPVAAAGILGVDLGLVLLVSIPISALALIPVIIYCKSYLRRFELDAEPDAEFSETEWQRQVKKAPGLFRSALPIVVPVLLIVLKSIAPYVEIIPSGFQRIVSFAGEPYIALFVGVLLSMLLPKKFDLATLSTDGWVGKSLKDAAIIILITGAGGCFGKVLQVSELSSVTAGVVAAVNIGIWLPFILASIFKTAQGSSTVAIIATASIISPLAITLGFVTPLEKALVVVMIGAGSAVVCHANDSFFWVVTQLSGIPVNKGLRTFTPGSAVAGFSAALIIFITYLIIH